MPPGSVEPFLLQQTIGDSSKVAAQSKKATYRAQTIKPTSGMDHRPKTEPLASSSSTPSSTSSSSTKNSTYDEYLALAKTTNFDAIRDAHFAYQSGLDFAGRPVVVVCGTMPEGASADDLFLYIIDLLDPIADGDYSVVYVVMPDGRKPSFGWLRKVYGNITRKYKKNLKQLFIVNPSFWVKAGFQFFRPFISSKFWKKVVYVTEMRQLYQFMSPTQIRFPAYVTDKVNFAKNAAALFGQSLEVAMTHPMNEGFEVPCLVHSAIEAIIAKGLKTEGIFRISGNANRIKELQEAFDKGTRVDLSQENEIHNVAGLLKRYLRQLPEPLIPFAVFPNMITVASEETPADIKQALIQALLCELSPLAFAILDRVIRLMGQIAANESFNKMGASNLAIVLGPNIMYAENDTPATAMANATAVNIIVKMFISDADVLFSAVRTKFDL
jgi:Rho GTPase-activating protein 1